MLSHLRCVDISCLEHTRYYASGNEQNQSQEHTTEMYNIIREWGKNYILLLVLYKNRFLFFGFLFQ